MCVCVCVCVCVCGYIVCCVSVYHRERWNISGSVGIHQGRYCIYIVYIYIHM